nr:putative integron gene cassette protein [uncultured bacterium]
MPIRSGRVAVCNHFRRLENMYRAAPINRIFEPKLEVTDGAAVLTMDVKPDFFHAANALHGSVYFKALDDAAFFAVNSLVRDSFVLTVSFTTYLLRPVTEGTLRAEGTVTSRSKNLFVAESVLYSGPERQVARGSGTFMRSRVSLESVDSYRTDA